MRKFAYAGLLVVMSSLVASSAAQAENLNHSLNDIRAFFTETCPVSRQTPEAIGPLLAAAVIPQLISSGVDFVGAALTAAGQDKATTLKTNTTFPFYQSDGETKLDRSRSFGCLVIIGTAFGYQAVDSSPAASEFPIETWQGAQIKEDPRLSLNGPPRFYFEAKVIFDKRKGAFRLQPVLYRLAESAERSFWGSVWGSEVSTTITLSFSVLGAATPFASHAFSFPKTDTPVEVQRQGLFGMTSEWLPMYPVASIVSEEWDKEKRRLTAVNALKAKENAQPPLQDTDDIKAKLKKFCGVLAASGKADSINCPDDAQKLIGEIIADRIRASDVRDLTNLRNAVVPATPKPILELAPTNVDIVIVETRAGSQFAAHLGAALTASKTEIVSAAKTQLPQNRRAAEKTAADAQSDAEIAFLNAQKDVIKAQDALDKLPADASPANRYQMEIDLSAAKIKANKAYRAAGHDGERYPGITVY